MIIMERDELENRYPYMSVENSDLYDKAAQNQIPQKEANLIICEMLIKAAEISQRIHSRSSY